MNDLRRWMTLCEARSPRRLTFASIARRPQTYVWQLQDAAVVAQEDLGDTDEEELAEELGGIAGSYAAKLQNGKMAIFRAISVTSHWNPTMEGLGIYWSHNIQQAHPHWGNSESYVVLHGVVGESGIDIWRTLLTEFTALTEDEVTLLPTADVLITNITDRSGKSVLPHLIGKTYKAKP